MLEASLQAIENTGIMAGMIGKIFECIIYTEELTDSTNSDSGMSSLITEPVMKR